MPADIDTDQNDTGKTRSRPSVLIPLVVLSLFAALLPARLASSRSEHSNEACLTLAERTSPPIELLQHCSALHPDDVEVLAELGMVQESTAPEKAESLYRRVLEADPGYADVRLRLARLLLKRGDSPQAVREAERGLTTQPNRQAFVDLIAAARQPSGAPR